jgi:hypothetical protein
MNLTELADSFGTISAEDYKLTAVYLDEALHLIVTLESRIATLEAELEERKRLTSALYIRVAELERETFGMVQS